MPIRSSGRNRTCAERRAGFSYDPDQTEDDSADTLLVIETCDVAGWVHDIAVALGMTVAVANPAHEVWRWTRVKRKTDKDDALKLAKLAVLGQLPTAHMPSPQQRQRGRLVHYRSSPAGHRPGGLERLCQPVR